MQDEQDQKSKKQLEQELLQRALQQTEDPMVRKALELVPSEYLPTVPIKEYDNIDDIYNNILKPIGDPRVSSTATAFVPSDKKAIYLSKLSNEYKNQNLYGLAAKLAHEQYHVTQPNYDRSEGPAYERELAIVDKYPTRFDPAYRQNLVRILQAFKKNETKSK